MKRTVTLQDFRNEFEAHNREESFSYNGLGALYDYLIMLEKDSDMELELDVIALCCEFTEYEDINEIKSNYTDIEDLQDLYNYTQVVEFKGGIIIQNF